MANESAQPKPQPEYDAGHVPITEEMDSARWSLPPVVPILIAFVVVAILVAVFTYGTRYKPVSSGEVQQVYAVEVPNQNSVLVAVQVNVRNTGDQKPLYLKGATAQLTGPDGKTYDDRAASSVDYERYFQAFPDLRQHSTQALQPGTQIAVGGQKQGTVIFGFPVDKNTFDQAKGLKVNVEFDDEYSLKLSAK